MEEKGIVGPFEGSKPRAVLLTLAEWKEKQGLAPAPSGEGEEDLSEKGEDG